MDKRKVIGNFWKAESNIKTKLYSFEDKGTGKVTQIVTENGATIHKLRDDFLKEIQTAIIEARAIVQDEQSKFFESVTYPAIDLGEILKDTGERAKGLVSAHVSPELEERNKQRQALETLKVRLAEQKDKIIRLEIEIEQRKHLVEKKRRELQTASKDETDTLKLEITTHQAKIRQAEDELERWHRPGLLFIGDAAHAMSPIGGVGINLAIQDAVAATNALAQPLEAGKPIDEAVLGEVQQRRLFPTRIIQALQVQAQKRLISKALEQSGKPPHVPAILRWLLQFRTVRNIPARLVGYGIRREHVRTGEYLPQA